MTSNNLSKILSSFFLLSFFIFLPETEAQSPSKIKKGPDKLFKELQYETALAAYNTYLGDDISLDQLVNAMSINPRKRFDLSQPLLEEGKEFQFTLFDPNKEWIYNSSTMFSKSSNSPFLDQTLKGKVIKI